MANIRWGNHRVTLDDLIGFAWSAPVRELAAEVGLSDVTGLGVSCTQTIYATPACLSVSKGHSITPPHQQTAQPDAG